LSLRRHDDSGRSPRGSAPCVLSRMAQPFSLDRFYVYQLPSAALWTGRKCMCWTRSTAQCLPSAMGRTGAGSPTARLFRRRSQPHCRPQAPAAGSGRGRRAVHGFNWGVCRNPGGRDVRAAGLSAAGAAVVTLQTPPKAPTDLSVAGVGTGTLVAAAHLSAALSAAARRQLLL